MKKIEIIWRELLFHAIEKKGRQFTQKGLAKKFGFSTSTIFQALKMPRKMGAVRVTGRFFILEDPKKLLFHWASVRNIEKDTIFKGRVNSPILEIEGLMPPGVIFGFYSAARHILNEPPADYDQVWMYLKTEAELVEIQQRLTITHRVPNLFILQADKFSNSYGQTTTIAQTFVDLWNLPSWQARDFMEAVEAKIDELLS